MSDPRMVEHLAEVTGLPDGRLTLRPKEVAHSLGLSPRKVDALLNQRRIPAFKVDSCWLIPVEALREWIAEQTR